MSRPSDPPTTGRRPVVGVTSYLEPAAWGPWMGVPAALLPHGYVAALEAAGAVVLLVPPRLDADSTWARSVLAALDGLVLAGGVDVDPDHYGADRHPSVQASRADRDAAELALATAAVEADLPLFGICRGMQVMAVAAGGELEQHVPDRVGHSGHSPEPGRYGVHGVRLQPGSRVAGILGEAVEVPSYHHQSVLSHPGYTATGWDPADGTLEAMEDPRGRFRLAVQWHPEVGEDPRLFRAFVAAC